MYINVYKCIYIYIYHSKLLSRHDDIKQLHHWGPPQTVPSMAYETKMHGAHSSLRIRLDAGLTSMK